MDTDGTQGAHGAYGTPDPGTARAVPGSGQVPRPAGPPPPLPKVLPRPAGAPSPPPVPGYAPGVAAGTALPAPGAPTSPFTAWLRVPRPVAGPGIWRYGHVPVAPKPVGSDRALLTRVVIAFLVFFVCWRAFIEGKLPLLGAPLYYFTPSSWWTQGVQAGPKGQSAAVALQVYELLGTVGLFLGFAKIGGWRAAFDRLIAERGPWYRAMGAAAGTLVVALLLQYRILPVYELVFEHLPYRDLGVGASAVITYVLYAVIYFPVIYFFGRLGGWVNLVRAIPAGPAVDSAAPLPTAPGGPDDPVGWPQLRAAGLTEAADRLAAEAAAGRMNDVDHVRIRRAWDSVLVDPVRRTAFVRAVRDKGAAACGHPSGARDLPARTADHDLTVAQVRLGGVTDAEPNPHERRGTGLALDPGVLGTSLLAVGPSGAGKTTRLVRPAVESLMLQALAGQAALIAVTAAGSPLGSDDAYDIVVRPGDPASVHDLDLYGGTTDPDEAAHLLAEAFVGDLSGIDVRRCATALAQLIGPFRAAYGRFPTVSELRELLDGVPATLGALRRTLEDADRQDMLRELDARTRQYGVHGDPGPALGDRIALLDRPAFHGFFDTTGAGRPFSLRALEHPVRVRVDLPERGHAEASRLLARLLLAQFNAAAAARADRSLFAFLAIDDASHTLTPGTVRGIQRLRSANAGVLLTLRTLDDVPEPLRTPLLGAVGCRMAFSGVTTWDGKWFADAWGTELVETRDVTSRTVYADQPMTRFINTVRKLITGKAVTTDAVTVRQVERERWSASALANTVPPGHAVLSLTSVDGERAAPLLVSLLG
ncbi:ATP/GTP-binding protein [Streptomyces sp. G-G2]|uniref:ATP/GTP-binding protein n=1 Tax=Streptomyces sp. G-G2 TaxID=3046201 RepID=UPI0024BA5E99|nr:ATP/GTP-binding protein [Streptomyces sp. G-G2]MDJ0383819.1 ATP/GTP-binding protein [Streptomyces sp. G-G2]